MGHADKYFNYRQQEQQASLQMTSERAGFQEVDVDI